MSKKNGTPSAADVWYRIPLSAVRATACCAGQGTNVESPVLRDLYLDPAGVAVSMDGASLLITPIHAGPKAMPLLIPQWKFKELMKVARQQSDEAEREIRVWGERRDIIMGCGEVKWKMPRGRSDFPPWRPHIPARFAQHIRVNARHLRRVLEAVSDHDEYVTLSMTDSYHVLEVWTEGGIGPALRLVWPAYYASGFSPTEGENAAAMVEDYDMVWRAVMGDRKETKDETL